MSENGAETPRSIDIAHPYEQTFRRQELNITTPPRILEKVIIHPEAKIDHLTGLPVEDNVLRRSIIENLGTCIKNGTNFACVFADVDQLKSANNIDRKLGDEVIKYGAAQVTGLVADLDLENVTTYITRQTDAADETVMWLFGLTDEQTASLKQKTSEFRRKKDTVTLDDGRVLPLSSSASLATSKDDKVIDRVNSLQSELNADPQKQPYGFYEDLKTELDDRVKIFKIAKEIANVPIDQASGVRGVNAIINLFAEEFGGQRTSKQLLKALMRISVEADRLRHDETPAQSMAEALGIDLSVTAITDFSLEDLRVAYFDSILQKTYQDINEE